MIWIDLRAVLTLKIFSCASRIKIKTIIFSIKMLNITEMLLLALQCRTLSKPGRSTSRKQVMKKTRQKRWKLVTVTMSVILSLYCEYAIQNPKKACKIVKLVGRRCFK